MWKPGWRRGGVRTASNCVRMGPLTFDERTHELFHKGQHLRLQPKPTLVLAELVAARGKLVERERLYEAAWGQTVVEFDLALNRCIKDIRAAVGDDARAPWFIATVPRRGYRLVAPVEAKHREAVGRSVIQVALIALVTAAPLLLRSSATTSSDPGADLAGTILSFQSFGAEVAGIDRDLQEEVARRLQLGTTNPRSAGLFVNGVVVPAPGGALLEVTLVRIADGKEIWTGRYNPLCDRIIGDPTQLIGGLISREVMTRS